MKLFKVYKHPEQGYKAVKIGFSWPGFFFVWFWAASKRLFILAFALFAGTVGLRIAVEIYSDEATIIVVLSGTILEFLIHLFVGKQGNELWAIDLRQKGFEQLGVKEAINPKQAIALITGASAEKSKPQEKKKKIQKSKSICPHCGKEHLAKGPYCSYCGENVNEITCPHCKKNQTYLGSHCTHCGKTLNKSDS